MLKKSYILLYALQIFYFYIDTNTKNQRSVDTINIQHHNEQLTNRLALQSLQIKRLLQITQAINTNVDKKNLFDMYKETLRMEMKVGSFILYTFHDNVCECSAFEGTKENLIALGSTTLFQRFQHFSKLNDEIHPLLQNFDYILPVFHKKQPLAFVLLGNIQAEGTALLDSIDFISTLTNIIAVAIENKRLFKKQLDQERLNRDLELAIQVQNMFIPASLPSNDKYEFSAVYQPNQGVGGDYYDFLEDVAPNDIAFCIADISGKGIGAALLMSNFQANLHAFIRKELSAEAFINELNAAVLRTTKGEKFITFFIARYNVETKHLRYICAGHNPPLLLTGGKLQKLDKGCTILGAFKKIPKIELGEIYLKEDAFLFLYTDGLTDMINTQKEPFDEAMLQDFILKNQDCTVAEFNQRLMEHVTTYKGMEEFPDDITILTSRLFVNKS